MSSVQHRFTVMQRMGGGQKKDRRGLWKEDYVKWNNEAAALLKQPLLFSLTSLRLGPHLNTQHQHATSQVEKAPFMPQKHQQTL